jgi:hypothetical protein
MEIAILRQHERLVRLLFLAGAPLPVFINNFKNDSEIFRQILTLSWQRMNFPRLFSIQIW